MSASPRPKRNVILITADSLRADHVGCYAGLARPDSLTPNLDALAARSAVFTQAFAQGPYTLYSVPPLLTGRYPCRLKRMDSALTWEKPAGVLVEGTPTVAELFRAAGYHTAAFHSNPLLSRLFGFQKGFDVFYDDVLLSSRSLPQRLKIWVARAHRVARVDPYLSARELNARVRPWLAEAPEPFFLWIHYMDTHGPYLSRKVLKFISRGERVWRRSVYAPESTSRKDHEYLQRLYRRQIRYLDAELGSLWEAFDRQGLLARSLLFFSADHGDEFREHGGYSHGHKVYDELIHVPLLVTGPGVPPQRLEHLAELIQIVPTALDFAGVQPADANGFDAESFLPWLTGTRQPSKSYIISESGFYHHEMVGIRTREWKLILEDGNPQKQLYRLATDAGEQVNVAGEYPAVVAQLEEMLAAHLSGPRPGAPSHANSDSTRLQASAEEEQLVLERLRDLGYI